MTFPETLQRHRISFRRSSSNPDEILLRCPWCGDNRFLLAINLKKNLGHCFNAHCDWKSRKAIPVFLRQMRIVSKDFETPVEETPLLPPVDLPKDFQVLDHVTDELDQIAQNYLKRRGLRLSQVVENKIGVSYTGRYAYRIIFPVIVDKLRAIVGRDFTGTQKLKYLNSVGDKFLYHFNPQEDTCVLSEGVFKALRIETALGLGSAALLGHDLTPIQLEQILQSKCRRIILWPDPDLVGRKGMVKVAHKLLEEEGWPGRIEIVPPITTPADELSVADLRQTFNTVQKYSWGMEQRLLLRK